MLFNNIGKRRKSPQQAFLTMLAQTPDPWHRRHALTEEDAMKIPVKEIIKDLRSYYTALQQTTTREELYGKIDWYRKSLVADCQHKKEQRLTHEQLHRPATIYLPLTALSFCSCL